MEDANFRKLYPEKNRNDEYFVDSDRCDDVLSDIERQENFINTVKEDTQKSDKQKKESIDDTRLYQLTMLEKLLKSECTDKKREYIVLINQINDILHKGMINESYSSINKQIKLKLKKLLMARLYSISSPNYPKRGGRSRRRKSMSKRTRRMRR